MRLVLINHEYPPLGGGAATATERLAEQFAASGHRVRVITSGLPESPLHEVRGRIEVVRLPLLRRSRLAPTSTELLGFCFQAATRLERCVDEFDADGMLAFFALPSGVLAARVARRLKLPLVVSLRGSDVPGFAGGRMRPWQQWLSRPMLQWALSQASFVAPNCPHLRDLTLKQLPELAGKTRIVANGIDRWQLADGPAGAAGREDPCPMPPRWITVGQLIPRKGVDSILLALHEMGRGAGSLTVVGDGPLRSRLRTLAERLGVRDRVRFLGCRGRDQIPALLRSHDIYVSASRSEGMSNACLEAMAAGLPIVTAANGSHDLVEASGCGVVYDLHDPDGLVAALRSLEDLPRRRRCARAGLNYVSRITWRSSADRFMRMFEECRATSRSGSRTAESWLAPRSEIACEPVGESL